MPVVYNRADTGKSKEELKNKNKKPATPKAKGANSGAFADLMADKPKAIGLGVGGLVLVLFLVWFLFLRGGGDSNTQDPGKIVGSNTGKPATNAGGGTAGATQKKGGAVGLDDDQSPSGGGGLKNRGSLGSGDEGIK